MEETSIHYNEAVQKIKTAILQSQHKVASEANCELLSLYYGIGRYVSEHTRKGFWGTNAIETISQQLQKELPGLRGYSASAIKRMRKFYEEWTDVINRPPAVDDIKLMGDSIDCNELANRPLIVDDLDIHDFLSISFTHHSEILAKAKTLEERIFYIKQAVRNHWTKDKLIEEIKADIYHHQSNMPNNFMQTMPS